eukprot:480582_1
MMVCATARGTLCNSTTRGTLCNIETPAVEVLFYSMQDDTGVNDWERSHNPIVYQQPLVTNDERCDYANDPTDGLTVTGGEATIILQACWAITNPGVAVPGPDDIVHLAHFESLVGYEGCVLQFNIDPWASNGGVQACWVSFSINSGTDWTPLAAYGDPIQQTIFIDLDDGPTAGLINGQANFGFRFTLDPTVAGITDKEEVECYFNNVYLWCDRASTTSTTSRTVRTRILSSLSSQTFSTKYYRAAVPPSVIVQDFIDRELAAAYCNTFHDGLATILSITDNHNARTICPPSALVPPPGCWIGLKGYNCNAGGCANYQWDDGSALTRYGFDSGGAAGNGWIPNVHVHVDGPWDILGGFDIPVSCVYINGGIAAGNAKENMKWNLADCDDGVTTRGTLCNIETPAVEVLFYSMQDDTGVNDWERSHNHVFISLEELILIMLMKICNGI